MADEGKRITERPIDYNSLGSNAAATVKVYGSGITNDFVELNVAGQDLQVLLNGTVTDVVKYAIGEQVKIAGKTFKRNVPRAEEEAVQTIREELYPKVTSGARLERIKFIVNEELLTEDSLINKFFKSKFQETLDKPQATLSGVNIVVSADITPGHSLDEICRW